MKLPKSIHKILAWLVCFSLVLSAYPVPIGAVEAAPAQSDGNISSPADPGVANQGWINSIQHSLAEQEYFITWQDATYLPDLPAAYQAPNRQNGLRTYFTDQGIIIIPRVLPEGVENLPWRFELRSLGWSAGERVIAYPPAELIVSENQVSYLRNPEGAVSALAVSEGYRNDEDGLAQLFWIQAPAGGVSSGSIQIHQALGGNLSPSFAQEGRELILCDASGGIQLHYKLHPVKDAGGQTLPAQLVLDGATLTVQVETAQAVYPVQVELIITGLPPEADWSLGLSQNGAQFGYAVATAGDVNHDGYSDVIIGAPHWDGGQTDEGRADVYLGWVWGLSVTPVWTKESNQANAHFGWSVATAGDVNRDRYADIIVGAPDWDDPLVDEGGAWIYHGSASGPHSAPDNYDKGNQAGARFGYSVATLGDVDKDQYSDVIVGAPYYDNGQTDEGAAFVWLGSASGVSAVHDWHAESNQNWAGFGISVAPAGDVNGDGYHDVVIGAFHYTHDEMEEGAAFLWFGDATSINGGVDGTPSNAAWRVESNQMGGNMGISVSTAGDVNGDGYADVIIGAHLWNGGQTNEGGAWIYHGSSTGLSPTAANLLEQNQAYAWFGFSVGTAGDVNGDGYADVIVGAPLYTNGETEEGRVWVWHGGPSGISATSNWQTESNDANAFYGNSVATAGDVNGDGYSDVIIGAPHALSPASIGFVSVFHGAPGSLQTSAGWTKLSNQANALFGFSVSTAGDVNGDGYADVIVGAPYWDGGQAFEGGAWVYHGSENGLISAPAWHKEADKSNTLFGYAVSTAGDVNGDGYDEVIVGAPEYDSPEVDEGGVWVYSGSASGLSLTPAWWKASDQAGAKFGRSVGPAGDINADGYLDIIVGAPYWDGDVVDEGGAWLYLGSAGGLISAPAWHSTNDQGGSEYGFSVGTAGDVNRDGFSDVIVGAPNWDNGQVNEGGVYLFLGGGYGLSGSFVWRQDGDVALARFGQAVGTAGDVNGDGFADFIVGAPGYENGQEGEGKVFVYAGSALPLSLTPLWQKESNQSSAQYGWSVGCAGDVNGDGFADIIVGARLWDGGEPGEANEGGAWVYHGSSTGPHSAPDWYTQGNQGSAQYGAAVGTAGDVNGDGYAEVIVGAPNFNQTFNDEGKAFLYYGNGGRGVTLRPRLLNADDSPMAHLGKPNNPTCSTFELLTYTPFGRGALIMDAEYKFLGIPFSETGVGDPPFYRNDPKGYVNQLTVCGFYRGLPHHWRVRLIYASTSFPFMPASRWVTNPWNGWQEKDFLSAGGRLWLPLAAK